MVGGIKKAQAERGGGADGRDRRPTPTDNTDLPFCQGDFASLPEALDYAARGSTGVNFYDGRGRLEHSLTYGEVRERAVALARRLLNLGLGRGDRVGITAEMHPDFLVGFFACQYAGFLPVPLPVPSGLGGRQGYEGHLARVLKTSGARVVLGTEVLRDQLERAAQGLDVDLITTVPALAGMAPAAAELRPLGPGEPSHIQYSSGSTRNPLGIIIDQDALMANAVSVARHGLQIQPGDRAASWLPFYHDMGLIGFMLIPITCQVGIDYVHTDGFARRPLQWLRVISDNRCTLGFSPTFGYELCVRRAAGMQELDLDLSSWRVAGIGGEMVRPETLADFAATFAPYGFRDTAFVPSYGLAEATLAFSFVKLGRGVTVDRVDKHALVTQGIAARAEPKPAVHGDGHAHGGGNGHGNGNGHDKAHGGAPAGTNGTTAVNGSANGYGGDHGHGGGNGKMNGNGAVHGSSREVRAFATCGKPLPGYQVEIRDRAGRHLPDRHVGRVFIKGPSLMAGYFNAREATAATVDRAGWLDTGDMGYVTEGTLVITGRQKDLIIVNGRNIWPQDLEWHAAEHVPEVRSRDCAAFAVEDDSGKEVPVILVQCRLQDAESRTRLRDEVHAAIFRNASIDCRVVLVPPRSLPFTTSGKLSRAKAKAAYLNGEFDDDQAIDAIVGARPETSRESLKAS